MCLSPLSLYTPSSFISLRGGQPLKLTVSCGHCAHCVTRKRDEYSFRTYWHTKNCIDNGGYVYFVTLTYDDEHVPKLSHFLNIKDYNLDDFTCFNREHYKLFFKRLRRRLHYKYGLVDALTYFFSTEYGDDDRFTHRPHYHVLLFMKNSLVHPYELSRIVSYCWSYGRTDGLPYKRCNYVARHVYGYNLGYGSDNSETWILRAVTHYVSKYINKSIKFQKELDRRIDSLHLALACSDNCEDVIKPLLSSISMFHQQSQGYGLSYLSYLDSHSLIALQDDKCVLPDKQKGYKELPLPMYYMRKLYYEQIKIGKKRYWHLTDSGKKHKIDMLLKSIDNNVSRYECLYETLPFDKKSYIDYLLNGRSFYDLVVYTSFYRGRLRSHSALNYYSFDSIPELDESEELDISWLDTLVHSFDSCVLDTRSIAFQNDNKDISISNYYGNDNNLDSYCPFIVMDRKDFIDRYSFSQKSSRRFYNFDVLIGYLEYLTREQNRNTQSTYDNKVELSSKLKQFTNVQFN